MGPDNQYVLSSSPVEIYHNLDFLFTSEDWLTWDAETLLLSCSEVDDAAAMDKLLAVKGCAFNVNVPTSRALAFEKTCTAFCNNACVMDAYQPLFMEEAFYGAQQIKAIVNVVHGDATAVKFTGEVPGYIASVAKHRSFTVLPLPLEFAQDATTFLTGYAPSADEIRLQEAVHSLTRAAMLDDAALDNLTPDSNTKDKVVAQLVRCYVYDPAGDRSHR